MLIGHYGVALLARRIEPRLSIGGLFVAAQSLDVVWCVLVLAGVERLRMVPGITATNGLDLEYMPFSHSLLAALLWGLAALLVCRGPLHLPQRSAWLFACVVSAHWPADWLVHRQDLALWPHLPKVGLGLWNAPMLAFVLEMGLLAAGMALYLRQSTTVSQVGRYGMAVLGTVMSGIQLWVFFGPVPMTARETVGWAFFGYIAFASIATALETQRHAGRASERHEFLPWLVWPQGRRLERRSASAKD